MMIAYIGLDGSGKTYHMAEVCQKLVKQGIDCFGTTPFEGARLLENHRQLLRVDGGHIFFDEWHQDLDAREWYHLDPVLKHIITQHRKYNLVIHWSAQAYAFMDPYVRRETTFVWDHEALFRDAQSGRSRVSGRIPFLGEVRGLHRRIKYPAWEVELKHRRPQVLSSQYFFIREKVYRTYDSYKKIALTSKHVTDGEIDAIRDPYKAEVIRDVKAVATVMHKRPVPDVLLTGPGATEQVQNKQRHLVGEQGRFDDDEQAEDRIELRERQENAQNLRAGLKVADPLKNGIG